MKSENEWYRNKKGKEGLKVGSEKKVNEDNCTVHVEDVLLIKEFYCL